MTNFEKLRGILLEESENSSGLRVGIWKLEEDPNVSYEPILPNFVWCFGYKKYTLVLNFLQTVLGEKREREKSSLSCFIQEFLLFVTFFPIDKTHIFTPRKTLFFNWEQGKELKAKD